MMTLLVPRASRLAHDAASLPEPDASAAAAALRRQTRLIATGGLALAVVMVVIVWPLASSVLVRIEKFKDIAPLALPMSLQAGIYLVQLPFTAALRAMHRAKMLFVQYVVFTGASLTALLIGASRGGLTGAAWGLTAGAFVGLVFMFCLYWHALRTLGSAEYDKADDSAPLSGAHHTVAADPLAAAGGPN
jgi:O-antigen/teichoic acid export membrane protein